MLSIITMSIMIAVLVGLAVYASLVAWVAFTAAAISDSELEPYAAFE